MTSPTRLILLATATLTLASCGQNPAPTQPESKAMTAQFVRPCEPQVEEQWGLPQPSPYCEEPGEPPVDPTPTDPIYGVTGQNLRVRLILDRVEVKDTEDVTPTWPSKPVDEFYTIGTVYVGAVSTGQGIEHGFSTSPFDAKKGKTYAPNKEVFTAVVAPGTQVASVARAYDEDINKDYNALKIATGAHKVAAFACDYLCKDPKNGEFKQWLDIMDKFITNLKKIWSGDFKFDADDNLHERRFDFGTLTKDQSANLYRTQRYSEGGIGFSTWDYDVRYRLVVEPTNDPVTQ